MRDKKIAEQIFFQLRTNPTSSLAEALVDFSRGEIGVLSYLSFDNDGVSAGYLSEKLNVTTARIASILNSLENKEYINRREDENDKRKTLVFITEKGKSLAIKAKDEVINKIIKVIKEVGNEEIEKYVEIVLKIKKILND